MLTPRKAASGSRLPTSSTRVVGEGETCVRSAFRGGWRRAERRRAARSIAALVLAIAIAFLLAAPGAHAQTAVGTNIDNVARGAYLDTGGNTVAVASNLDRLTVAVRRTDSTVEFLKYGAGIPGATPTPIGPQTCSTTGNPGGPYGPSPPITDFSGNPIDVSSPVPLVADGAYHAGEPVFVRVVDPDQNLDPAVVETVELLLTTNGGDRETLRLSENDPNSGVFVGYIQSATPPPVVGDCRISVGVDETIRADYSDPVDGSDASSDTTLVDPFGVVFDSATGAPVDGAVITLWDVLLGAPATVVGDDGLSAYPSTVTSGGTATDASGRVYTFGPGRFRFPFVAPGRYALRVSPPSAYAFPTGQSDAALQSLPGAPYAIVIGSRGEDFTVPVGPAVQVDLPLDPLSTGLLVTKQAMKDRVGVGEFVPYRVRATNATGATLVDAALVDVLPAGFRFERGSGERVGGGAITPAIADDGAGLRFALGDVAPGETVELVYVARIGPNVGPGEYTNRVVLEASGGIRSNEARARVTVAPDLFSERAWLLGRVHVDGCDVALDAPADGLGGVRVMLEDGSFVVTDDEGRFHFEAISPGLHVVQLDLDTIPEAYEPVLCDRDQRKARRAFSEFVEVGPGTLWRTDFHLRRKRPDEGVVSQTFEASRDGDRIDHRLLLAAEGVAARDVTAMIRLSEDVAIVADSGALDGEAFPLRVEDGMLLARIGDLEPGETRTLAFATRVDAAARGAIETRSVVRARPAAGRAVMTEPVVLRVPARRAETPAVVEPETPPAPAWVLDHRLLGDRRGGLMHYVLQVYVDDTLPDVIVAEVRLPRGERILSWTPQDELGKPVTSTRVGEWTRFILSRRSAEDAVRVFVDDGRPQNVLQVFFAAKPLGPAPPRGAGARDGAISRILPSTGPGLAPPARVASSRGARAPQVPAARGAANRGPPGATNAAAARDARAHALATGADPSRAGAPTPGRAADVRWRGYAAAALREVEAAPAPRPATSTPRRTERPKPPSSPAARFGADWLEQASPGNRFVYPEPADRPRIPSLKLGIQHDPALRVELWRNGEPVNEVHREGRVRNRARTIALTRWRGIGLDEGPNVFEAIFRDASGREVERAVRTVHLSGAPTRGELAVAESTLVADGRTPPVVAIRLFDRWGEPVRGGATGQFTLDPPYQTREEVEAARTRPLAGLGFEQPSYVVGEDGIARITLHPTSVVGEARLRFPFREDRETELLAWLEPGDRDWVLVGLATGTLGWNTASGDDRARRLGDAEDGRYEEGRVAFYAKGRVPGRFLLTAAYDSDASETRLRDRLRQTLEPDEHYTLYGDTTQRDFDAPTSGRLFVKIERKRFYALYGDYDTGLEETELGRYSRRLTGAKVEYRGRNVELNAFATDTDQSFVRDEISGDGTSGLYRLSRERVVPGSEKISLEVRDRFRPEIVLSSEPQARFTDYDIDYADGTLFFRRPIPGQDPNFDPIFIVVDYETNDRAPNAWTGGGRVAGRSADGRVEVGFTGIHEGSDQIDSQLFAGDATIALDAETELRAEFAHSRGNDFDGEREGEAWLVELDHRSERLDLRAYVKEQGSDFGLGQQRGTQTELRSYGVDAGFDWSSVWRSDGTLFRQENLATDAQRHVAEWRTRWEHGRLGANAGLRYAHADTDLGSDHAAQALLGGRADLFDGRLALRAEGEAAVSEDAFGQYPHRAMAGADWKLHERLTLFVDQEMTFGDDQRTADTRGGLRGMPWKGASVTTSVVQEQREFGPRTYANLGLQQRFDVATNWGFDVSLDRTATIRDPGNPAFDVGAPAPSGSFSDDYTAISVGTAYRDGGWSGTARVEARFGEREDRFGVVAGLLRDANGDLSWSARIDFFHSDARSGVEEWQTDTSLSLAYRPLRSRWIVLDRLDFRYRESEGDDFAFQSRKLLHHLKLNQLFDRRTQLAWQLANKLVVDTLEGRQYESFGTLAGLEMRRDFAPGWDMSIHGRARHMTGGDEVDFGYGLSVGRILVDNVWLSVGYNLVGFVDPEFSAADYTAQGPFLRIRAKFDQLSVREAIRRFR